MSIEIEISQLDLRYEDQRVRSVSAERQLLLSIMEGGIRDPVSGACLATGERILLDGFKRLRCARKLGMGCVPFVSLGEDEASAIINMIRLSQARNLSLLEQAIFVENLHSTHGLSVAEIATRLQKSKSWVRVRLQMFSEMSAKSRSAIMSGNFPLYSYLYTLHPYRRLPGDASKAEVDEFVGLVGGKALSTREIDLLAPAFFRGGEKMRAQIRHGDLGWCLDEMKKRAAQSVSSELSEAENRSVRDLEVISGSMGRLSVKLQSMDVTRPAFRARADLLAEHVLSKLNIFIKVLKDFNDRCRQAKSDPPSPQ